MLVSLVREKFDELVPKIATVEQYRYTWGKTSDFLRRILIAGVGRAAIFLLRIFGPIFDPVVFVGAALIGTSNRDDRYEPPAETRWE